MVTYTKVIVVFLSYIKKHSLIILILFAIIITIFIAFFGNHRDEKIRLNQQYEEALFKNSHSISWDERFNIALSNYSAILNSVLNNKNSKELDFSNPKSVFDFVFNKIPYYAIVYPTEMYYYFTIPSSSISGNLKFTDVGKGELSFAYFDTQNPLNFQHQIITEKEGLDIKIVSKNIVYLSYNGKGIYFRLPLQEEERPQGFVMISDEDFVAKIQEESGLRFYLLFNNKTNSFYYVINPEQPFVENLKVIDEKNNLFLGEQSKYVYYKDEKSQRIFLVGVNAESIKTNDYYDGPFDQVPPRLEIREKLYKAYPYTQYLNGLDANGNFYDFEGSRVAISPYVDYTSKDFSEIRNVVDLCKKDMESSIFWSCITYESKKDFHKTIPEFFNPDGTKR